MILPFPQLYCHKMKKIIAKNRKNMNFAGRVCRKTIVPIKITRGITDNTIIYFINIGSRSDYILFVLVHLLVVYEFKPKTFQFFKVQTNICNL